MKTKLSRIYLSIICVITLTFSQAQVWQWSTMHDYNGEGWAVTNDNNGNTFFSSVITGTGVLGTTTISGSGVKGITSKYDTNGNLLWANYVVGGSALGIDCDNLGNVYASGSYASMLIVGTQTLYAVGAQDIYIIKYDNAGNLIWAISAGGSASDVSSALSIDSQGNPIITGYLTAGTATFGTLTLASNTLSYFVAKYDPSGNCLWVVNSTTGTSQGAAVCADLSGNVYVCGQHQGMTIGANTLTSAGNYDYFLAKLNSAGSPIWVTNGGGTLNEGGANVSVDPYGEVYMLGRFSSSLVSIGSQTIINNSSSQDIFLAKYTATGANLWAQAYTYTGTQQPYGLAAYTGGVYFTSSLGTTSYTIGTYTFSSTSTTDGLLLANVGSAGNLQYATALSGGGDDVMALHMDNMCNLTLGGDLAAQNVQVGNSVFTHTSGEALFVAKFNSGNTTPTLSIVGSPTVCAGASITLSVNGASTYTWSNGVIGNSIVVAPSTNTSYAVIGISPNYTCQAKLTQNIAVIPSSVSVNVSNTLICQGSSSTLNVLGATTSTWNNGFQTPVISVSPQVSTTYSVSGTSTSGCSYQSARTISVLVSPNLTTSHTQTTMCKGTKLTMTASGASTYTWSTGAQVNSILYTAQTTTIFSVVGTGTINGCTTTKTIQVTVAACIGLEEETTDIGLNIFPNPSNGNFVLRLTNSDAMGELIIYELTGRLVKIIVLDGSSQDHKIELPEKGIYFANYKNSLGEMQTRKLVVE